jgi:hypothetical protein
MLKQFVWFAQIRSFAAASLVQLPGSADPLPGEEGPLQDCGTHTNFMCVQLQILANQVNPVYTESVPT